MHTSNSDSVKLKNNYSITGTYANCRYGVIANVPNREFNNLAIDHIMLLGEHLPLVNFFHKTTTGMILGDGGITRSPGVKMAVAARDCVPLIIMGPHMAALIHISWRNLYLKILDNVKQVLQRENMDLSEVQVVIGPHIDSSNMEFGLESLWLQHSYYKPEFFIKKTVGGETKTYFDMESMIMGVITQWKVNSIIKIPIDTFNNKEYASFRRDGLGSALTNIFTVEML